MIRASRYLPAVKPWEWLDVPAAWLDWTLTAMSAEAEADEARQQQAAQLRQMR